MIKPVYLEPNPHIFDHYPRKYACFITRHFLYDRANFVHLQSDWAISVQLFQLLQNLDDFFISDIWFSILFMFVFEYLGYRLFQVISFNLGII